MLALVAALVLTTSLTNALAATDGKAPAEGTSRSPVAGDFTGSYGYDDPTAPLTSFSLTLTDVSRQVDNPDRFTIKGVMSEPRTNFGPEDVDTLTSTFEGTYAVDAKGIAHVRITKTYDYDKQHKVEYKGSFDEDAKIFTGKWAIGTASGPFTLSDLTTKK
ncbi:hypothetical protein DB346_10590 [Verrucomicrobia bacterium LW23]|nr:hypothetical protein DB346_10590 [Verrucomicrobia bacterium LW23]